MWMREKVMADEHAVPIARMHLRQSVTSRILTGIFRRKFLPGSRLVAQHLCDLYQVSQTPVREALQELEALRIVDLSMNRGAVVRPFGPQQVHEMGQVRRVLEVEATRCACGRIPTVELMAIETALVELQGMSSETECLLSRQGRRHPTAYPDQILLRQRSAGLRDQPLSHALPRPPRRIARTRRLDQHR